MSAPHTQSEQLPGKNVACTIKTADTSIYRRRYAPSEGKFTRFNNVVSKMWPIANGPSIRSNGSLGNTACEWFVSNICVINHIALTDPSFIA